MRIFLIVLNFLSLSVLAQTGSPIPAQPDVLPPSPPLQSVNTGTLQMNNNVRTTAPTPAFSPTPAFQPQQPMQQEQRVSLPQYIPIPNPTPVNPNSNGN